MDNFSGLPPEKMSWHMVLGSLPMEEQKKFLEQFTIEEIQAMQDDWSLKLRREQFPPEHDDWKVWYINAGRGFGKTVAGSNWVNIEAEKEKVRIALIGPTSADCRDVMVEGPTGIMATASPSFKPVYAPSLRKVTWPNGSEAHLYSAFSVEDAERLRGPQHHLAWCDEIAAWRQLQHAWDMLNMGLRLGVNPRMLCTTTPKPRKILKDIKSRDSTVLVRGSTYDNMMNLPESFRDVLIAQYEGTRLGRQELYAEDLEEAEGALWTRDLIETTRKDGKEVPDIHRTVVGIDPAMTANADSDEVGIVVGSIGADKHLYIRFDHSARLSPGATCTAAVRHYNQHSADRVIAEANNGGDWIELGIRQVSPNIPYKKLHASRAKKARAEPVAALFEQGKAHIVGVLPELEDELCSWEPVGNMPSPNRLDAMVWVATELMLSGRGARMLKVIGL